MFVDDWHVLGLWERWSAAFWTLGSLVRLCMDVGFWGTCAHRALRVGSFHTRPDSYHLSLTMPRQDPTQVARYLSVCCSLQLTSTAASRLVAEPIGAELSCCWVGSLMDTNSLEAMLEQGRPALSRRLCGGFSVPSPAKPGKHRVSAELSCCWAGSLMDTKSLGAMMEQGRPFLSCLVLSCLVFGFLFESGCRAWQAQRLSQAAAGQGR